MAGRTRNRAPRTSQEQKAPLAGHHAASLPQRAESPLRLLLPPPALGTASHFSGEEQPPGPPGVATWRRPRQPLGVSGHRGVPKHFSPISPWTEGWAAAGGGAGGASGIRRRWRKPRKEGPASLGRRLLGGPLKVYALPPGARAAEQMERQLPSEFRGASRGAAVPGGLRLAAARLSIH